MINAVAVFGGIVRDIPAATARIAGQAAVRRDVEAFAKAAAQVETLDDFMASGPVSRFAMKAFGLEGVTGGKALVRRVLAEGADEKSDLANRLNDDRYRQMAALFTFDEAGNATFDAASAIEAATSAYERQVLEEQVGSVSEGARLALYFDRMAETIDGPWSILADRNLATVVRTALGAPASVGAMDLEWQASWLEAKLDIPKLKDGAYRAKFLQRFIARHEMKSVAGSDPRAGLLRLLEQVASPRAS